MRKFRPVTNSELRHDLEEAEKKVGLLETQVADLKLQLDEQHDDIAGEQYQLGYDECARGVLDYMRLVSGGMTPLEAAGIVARTHDLDRELVDEMYRLRIPNPELVLPKKPKPKRKK